MGDGPKDPPLGEAAALRELGAAMPGLRWTAVRYVDEGWDHEVLLLDDRLVVRFPNDDHYRRMFPAEQAVIERLADATRVALPRVRAVAADGRLSLHDMVPGERLTPERFHALAAGDREAIAHDLADLLVALHRIEPSVLPAGTPTWSVEEEDAHVAELARTGLPALLSRDEMRRVEEILADVPGLVAASPEPVLVHGDVYEDHLLWDGRRRRIGLLDFSDLATGDPAIDFAELIDYGRPFLEAVVARYGGDDALLGRAVRYGRWLAVYLMADHLESRKTPFGVARIPFDRRAAGAQ
ncbi:MAG: phosphotransferase family protein [Amnibacterium sp.]